MLRRMERRLLALSLSKGLLYSSFRPIQPGLFALRVPLNPQLFFFAEDLQQD
jgi:hypothetical protein